MLIQVAYNNCYGGFHLSDFACKKLIEMGVPFYEKDPCHDKHPYIYSDSIVEGYHSNFNLEKFRIDERLIRVLKKYGSIRCSGPCSDIKITSFEVEPSIDYCDGKETIEGMSCIEVWD